MNSTCDSFTGFEGLNGSTGVPTAANGQSFNRTRAGGGGGGGGTPPTSSSNKLGYVNFDGYCKSLGYVAESLDGQTINDWHCEDASGNRVGIDVGSACTWQYQTNAIGKWDDFNTPTSWNCFGPASSSASLVRSFDLHIDNTSGAAQLAFKPGDSLRIIAILPQAACVTISEVKPDGSTTWITQGKCLDAGKFYWPGTFGSETGWRTYYLQWQDSSGTWQQTYAFAYVG
jgi:hypothetical protein